MKTFKHLKKDLGVFTVHGVLKLNMMAILII